MKSIFKSIGAVFAGLVFIFATSMGTDFILESQGIFPPFGEGLFIHWMLVVAFVYRSIYAVLGCYLTARLAPQNPMRHALLLGSIGFVLSIFGAITMWDMSHHWYPIALVLFALPTAYLGGKLAK